MGLTHSAPQFMADGEGPVVILSLLELHNLVFPTLYSQPENSGGPFLESSYTTVVNVSMHPESRRNESCVY